MIYFAQDSGTLQIKIGCTANVDGRIAALQIGNPSKLVVHLVMEGGRETEAELHRDFAASRTTGEWFRPTPDLISFIVGEQSERAERHMYESLTNGVV